MAQFDALLKSDLARSVAIGVGAVILVPVAVKVLAPILRPLARSTLKAGIMAYEKGREAVAELGEVMDDLVAEVQEELQLSREHEQAQASQGVRDEPPQGATQAASKGSKA